MEKSILHIAGQDALVLVFWLSTYCQEARKRKANSLGKYLPNGAIIPAVIYQIILLGSKKAKRIVINHYKI